MKALGAMICEILGDPKWTKRLEDTSQKYYKKAMKTPTSDKSERLFHLSARANALADINKGRFVDTSRENYREATHEMYPQRTRRQL